MQTSSGIQTSGVFLCKAEDEEVFEEIRRLRLERGRLLQKIKALELQQQSALTALEEVLHACCNTSASVKRVACSNHHFYMCARISCPN